MSSRDAARHLTAAALLAFALIAAALGGCGKKGPPLPPLRFVPAPTKDLALEQRGNLVILDFGYPKTTPAGAALNGVSTVEVWELTRPAPPPAPPAPAAAAAPAPGTTTPKAPATTTAPATAPKPPTGAAGAALPPGATPTPAVGAPSVPPPAPSLPGGFPPLDPRELEAMAKLKLKLQGPEIAAATLGDKVVVTLPLPEPSPAAGATAAASAAPKTAPGAKPGTGTNTSTTAANANANAAPRELAHYYAVRTTGPKGDRSAFSNQVAFLPQPPPAPPSEVKLTPKADGIEVAWTEPAPAHPAPATTAAPTPTPAPAAPKILGFNVYRRDASAKSFGAPLRAAFPDARSIVDTTARFGESYIYSVTSIANPNPLLESAIRSEVEIKYVDRFPPPAPTDVVALAEAGSVRVVWRASAAPDLAGYLVYRRTGAKGEFKKMTARPIEDVQYLDATVAAGAAYVYRVTAVDRSGNESAPGEAQTRAQ